MGKYLLAGALVCLAGGCAVSGTVPGRLVEHRTQSPHNDVVRIGEGKKIGPPLLRKRCNQICRPAGLHGVQGKNKESIQIFSFAVQLRCHQTHITSTKIVERSVGCVLLDCGWTGKAAGTGYWLLAKNLPLTCFYVANQ